MSTVTTTTEAEICSNAFGLIGERSITTLTEDNERARLALRNYPITRDALLQTHSWNFAIGRAKLTQKAVAPAFQWSTAYALPSDYLAVVRFNPATRPTPEFSIEGIELLTDEGSASLVYVKQITDVSLFPPLFRKALEAQLAAVFAYGITQKRTMIGDMEQLTEKWVSLAKLRDAQSGVSEIISSDALIDVRMWG